MPYPFAYGVATQTFLDVLEAVREETALSTTNQAFTVLEGVLRVFRRRIGVQESLRFADTLPVALYCAFCTSAIGISTRIHARSKIHFASPTRCAPYVAGTIPPPIRPYLMSHARSAGSSLRPSSTRCLVPYPPVRSNSGPASASRR